MKGVITLALSKGRILEDTLPILSKAGVTLCENPKTSRKLLFTTNLPYLRVVILRASDVLTYVENGAADIGVTGKDVLMEHGGSGLYEMLDLNIAKCRLMVAEKKGESNDNKLIRTGRVRVATKYINISKRYFAEKNQQVDIVKLYGSMELAPLLDLSDIIVDVVDTGATLAANGLVATEHIADISSRLVVNSTAMNIKNHLCETVIGLFAKEV